MRKISYLTSTILCTSFAVIALPDAALAQDTPAAAVQTPDEPPAAQEDGDAIVVTGSLFRRTNSETPSPVTVLSAEALEQRGLNTVAEAMQRISANGAGTISQGWNTGSNFASGATAPSLRGLTVQSTLSISDGLRLAPYPLADDGQRNFVDLNTIPTAAIERIEVLRDGASSTYGADAIAGVINVITKKAVQGLHLDGSAGISQRGDAGEQRISAVWGTGDLEEDRFNFYLTGEYQRSDSLRTRDRDYPYNSGDLTRVCNAAGSCMSNNNLNSVTAETGVFNGLFSVPGVALVRPVNLAGAATGNGRYAYLNPGAGCRGFKVVTITAAQSGTSPLNICEVDNLRDYRYLQPEVQRYGGSARITVNLGDRAQLYAMAQFYDTKVHAVGLSSGFNGTPPPPRPLNMAAYNTILPVYVCAAGVGTLNGLNTGCNAANGTLNPYNPYAAAGQTAHILYRSNRQTTTDTDSRTLRGVIGVDGSFGDGWDYSVSFTAMNSRLIRTQAGFSNLQRVADAVARGQFNFFEPDLTPQSVYDYIAPESRVRSDSDLWQASATLAKDVLRLPGGPLQVAVGAQLRHEAINAPSANPENTANPYNRYVTINAVGTKGSREVRSAFFEINAPILEQIEINASGRYDDYSSGQSNFSPKIGAKFTPIKQLAVRGTFSKGFRIPSFNESFGLPTTGFVARQLNPAIPAQAAFIAAHGGNAYATGAFNLGLTQVGNPNLKPERSTSFTLGAIFEPIRNVSFTADYWQIRIKDLITGLLDNGPAFNAYYANNGVVNIPGVTAVLPAVPDVAFPNALPQIGFIVSPYQNTSSQLASGFDFGMNARFNITEGVTLTSNAEASYQLKYEVTGDGQTFDYAGTLSPCNITSCSGSPRWRANWQNTLQFGGTTVSATVYYTSGYDNASIDFGGIKGDCAFNAANHISVASYNDGSPILCNAKATWNVDLTASQKIGNNFLLYLNVLNVLDLKAPFDPSSTYQIFQFNPAWAGPNIMGRYFRVGAKVDF